MGGSRRRRPWPLLLALLLVAGTVAGLLLIGGEDGAGEQRRAGADRPRGEAAAGTGPERQPARTAEGPAQLSRQARFRLRPAPETPPVSYDPKQAPRAGLLFDIDTGEVLWERHPRRELPIASLTKMMTALLISSGHRGGERVKVSKRAAGIGGSKIGLLPEGTEVRLEPLLYGLLLVSGNDAAIALAEHDAGSVERFVRRMNREARRRGLDCSRFSTPHGLDDAGNRSCPRDLAAMARAILADGELAKIVGSEGASFRFPIEAGKLELVNNNPLMLLGRPGITGVKTGLTDAAGRCYVTTAERAGHRLGVVLLHSPDPVTQIDKLLDKGVRALGR